MTETDDIEVRQRFALTLDVGIPPVEADPVELLVRCGETAVLVREIRDLGSGAWRVWTTKGEVMHHLSRGDTTYEATVAAARQHVEDREIRRRMARALDGELAKALGPPS